MSTTLASRIVNGYQRLVVVNPAIYDATETIGSTITSGTAHTLPSSGTYQGDELEIYFNGIPLDPTTDYSSVGSGTKTQITFSFDLHSGDQMRYKTQRGP